MYSNILGNKVLSIPRLAAIYPCQAAIPLCSSCHPSLQQLLNHHLQQLLPIPAAGEIQPYCRAAALQPCSTIPAAAANSPYHIRDLSLQQLPFIPAACS
jgi:hypothetical protein